MMLIFYSQLPLKVNKPEKFLFFLNQTGLKKVENSQKKNTSGFSLQSKYFF